MASRQTEAIKAWLALEAWRYGNKFGPKGPVMIAQCLNNRVKAGWGLWHQVLNDIPKFNAINVGEEPSGYPDPYDPEYIRLMVEIDKIFSGESTSLISTRQGDCLFFGDLGNITRQWFLDTIVRNPSEHTSGANYGLLTFWT